MLSSLTTEGACQKIDCWTNQGPGTDLDANRGVIIIALAPFPNSWVGWGSSWKGK